MLLWIDEKNEVAMEKAHRMANCLGAKITNPQEVWNGLTPLEKQLLCDQYRVDSTTEVVEEMYPYLDTKKAKNIAFEARQIMSKCDIFEEDAIKQAFKKYA